MTKQFRIICREAGEIWNSGKCLTLRLINSTTYDETLQPARSPTGPLHTISVNIKGPVKDGMYSRADMIFSTVIYEQL